MYVSCLITAVQLQYTYSNVYVNIALDISRISKYSVPRLFLFNIKSKSDSARYLLERSKKLGHF